MAESISGDHKPLDDIKYEDIQLTEQDIPGTHLDEPLEKHSVKSLHWWLQCHGETALKKVQLIERLRK